MVRVLRQYQVVDRQRGPFYVRLKRTKRKHQGRPVYKDKVGNELVIVD